jgi:hypothetical protein
MTKVLFLAHLLILLLVGNALSAQTSDKEKEYAAYYNLCNEALILKVNKEYAKAAIKYEQAFEEILPFIDDLKELKACYKQLGDTAMMADVWKRMVLAGFTTNGTSYLLTPNRRTAQWTNYFPDDEQAIFAKINYDSLHQVFMTRADMEKHNHLQAIITGECFAGAVRAYYADDSLYYFIEQAAFMTNGRLLLNLLKSDYMPSRKESNLWNDERFNAALTHIAGTFVIKNEEQDAFFDLLKQRVLMGDLYPAQYAVVYDHTYDGECYGMGRQMNDAGEIEAKQPKDIQSVDARRAEIFLPPLWVWAKKTGFSLPQNYIP